MGRTCVAAGVSPDMEKTLAALLEIGVNVAILTNKPSGEELAARLDAAGFPGSCRAFAQGGNSQEAQDDVFCLIYQSFGSIDAIVCGKGCPPTRGLLDDLTVKEFARAVSDVASGAFGMLRSALPFLRMSDSPLAVFLTSREALHGGTREDFAPAVGRGAVAAFVKLAAARLEPEGIPVCGVARAADEGDGAEPDRLAEAVRNLFSENRAPSGRILEL